MTAADPGHGPPRERSVAFDRAVLACGPGLRRFALSLTRDAVRAEDLLQDTYVRAFKSHDRFQEGTNMAAWLTTIMHNHFMSLARKNGREVEDPDDLIAKTVAVPMEQEAYVELKDVRRRMRLMPKAMREALLLITLGGETYEDAAAILKTEVGTIKSRVHRAKEFLEGGELVPEDPPAAKPELAATTGERIAILFGGGASVSEIAATLQLPRTEVMRAVMELRLTRRKPAGVLLAAE